MKANILIIDDDQNKLDSLELILKSLDQNIIKCLSGAQGLRAILANDVAVILLDVNMPVMDGFETAKLIRNRTKTSGIPIIFITAYNTGELDVAKGYSLGAVDYIFFPFNESFLLAKLKVFLEIHFLRKKEQIHTQELAEINNKLLTTNERLAESEKQLKQLNEELENRVNERTERIHKREEQLKFLSNQLEAILDHIPGLVFYKDNKNNFIRVNKYVATAHKMSKEELENKNLADIYPEKDAAKYYKDDLEVINSGVAKLNIEEPWSTETGLKWVNTSKIPFIDNAGKIIGIIGMSYDITERKQAQKLLQQAHDNLEIQVQKRTAELAEVNSILQIELDERQKIIEKEKELNMLKTRFISVISHEFRTPLTGIQSSVQLFERYGDKWEKEKKQKFFNTIYNSVRFASLLLDDISLMGNDESGKLNFKTSLCIIEEICRQAVDDIKAVFGNETIINYSINPDSIKMFADDSLLRHIINNLLSNSVKYSGAKKQVEFSAAAENNNVVFTFTDHGIGIPKEDQKHLFESFYRASNVESIKGTGLGLAIVKRCVELHKGSIEIKSSLNKGTTVVVKIPYIKPDMK